MSRAVPEQARGLAAALEVRFARDAELATELADAQRRLQRANDRLWSGLHPDGIAMIYGGVGYGGQLSALRSVAHDAAETATLAPLAQAWQSEVRATYLSSYDAVARPAMLYGSARAGSGLLGLFELEKALYELRYELSNRPAWAGIPLQGILECAAQ